jgi:DNA-binding response OmpR family regulator
MKRRILLVDDEVAVLLTLKAVLEISGFDVDTAASAREGKSKLRTREYHMVISDMRMESDAAGAEVIAAARAASYHPAIALLTAFPVADDDWQGMGADKMLVKPMHTKILLQQIEKLLASHESKLSIWAAPNPVTPAAPAGSSANKPVAKKVAKKAAPAAKKAAKRPAPTAKPPSKVTKKKK